MDGLKTALEGGVSEGVFPGAVVLVAHKGEVVFFDKAGFRALAPVRAPMEKDTIFDLASLTKVLATTLAMMKLVDSGAIDLDQPLSQIIPGSDLGNKKALTPRLILTHSAGFKDWKPFYLELVKHPLDERKGVLRERIIQEPLAYEPGTGMLYSDFGFMLLEWVIEERAGQGLAEFLEGSFYGPLGLKMAFFTTTTAAGNPLQLPLAKRGGEMVEAFAATEECPWRKRVIQGETHDENAWTLGGYSGHAGLFGTARDIWILVNLLREHYFGKRSDFFRPETVREFFRRQDMVKGSDWALGWDTRALVGSSAGRYFSRSSVGHTGFTGTSIWMDLEKDVVAVLLSNRVHPTRDHPEKIKAFRPKIHDAVMEELGERKWSVGVLE